MGKAVDNPQNRGAWLAKLPTKQAHFRARQLLRDIDHHDKAREQTRREISRQGRQFHPTTLPFGVLSEALRGRPEARLRTRSEGRTAQFTWLFRDPENETVSLQLVTLSGPLGFRAPESCL